MSLSTNQSLLRGTFTSDGVSQTIDLPWLPSLFKTRNITKFGNVTATTPVMLAERSESMQQASALTTLKTSGVATLSLPDMNLTEGMSFIDNSSEIPGPELTGTAISVASPAVVTIANHGLAVGQRIRLYSTTGMLQIAGIEFMVVNVLTINTFEILLAAAGFGAPATAVNARTIPESNFYPRQMWITGISQAPEAGIQLSFFGENQFDVGQEIRLIVPPEFGMVEANDQRARITSVNNAAGTITIDLNTTAFTAFSFPTSAVAEAGVTFPQLIPFGKFGEVGNNAQINQWNFQVFLGTNAIGVDLDVMEWEAHRSLNI